MQRLFITKIRIDHVRHLRDIEIPVSDGTTMKHLILTGKNGSGKTSLLEALRGNLAAYTTGDAPCQQRRWIEGNESALETRKTQGSSPNEIRSSEKTLAELQTQLEASLCGVSLTFNRDANGLRAAFEDGEFLLAYYGAHRTFEATVPKSIEKVQLKDQYGISETPRQQFLKYMLDLKMTQALAASGGKAEKAEELQSWFDRIQGILRDVYEDDTLVLEFDEDTYAFLIHTKGHDSFDFNSASDGFSAVLDIVLDLILRMQRQERRTLTFDEPGIVLIDEVENHLHLELQKRILGYLTDLFPNLQFIVTTHSPFVVNSLPDAVIYDLENGTLVENGLADVSYSGVVEGYFESSELSEELERKFTRYKTLANMDELSDSELAEVAELELYLDEMPDYLMLDVATEYKRLKLEFHNRQDL